MTNDLIDECREAFEAKFGFINEYRTRAEYNNKLDGWNAARDYYAPMLTTEKASMILAEKIMEKSYWTSAEIIEALAAAGVRFKPSSTEETNYAN